MAECTLAAGDTMCMCPICLAARKRDREIERLPLVETARRAKASAEQVKRDAQVTPEQLQ